MAETEPSVDTTPIDEHSYPAFVRDLDGGRGRRIYDELLAAATSGADAIPVNVAEFMIAQHWDVIYQHIALDGDEPTT